MDNGRSRKVSFLTVLRDMLESIGYCFWVIAFVSFLVVVYLVLQFGIVIEPDKLPKTLIEIIPELMGFLIAGLAIIMGFNEGTLKRLSIPADDDKIPLKVIIASFSVCLLILLATLIVSTIYVNNTFTCEGCRGLFGVRGNVDRIYNTCNIPSFFYGNIFV